MYSINIAVESHTGQTTTVNRSSDRPVTSDYCGSIYSLAGGGAEISKLSVSDISDSGSAQCGNLFVRDPLTRRTPLGLYVVRLITLDANQFHLCISYDVRRRRNADQQRNERRSL